MKGQLIRRIPEKQRRDRQARQLVLLKESPFVRKALRKIMTIIGDRDELHDAKRFFRDLDTNGNGELDLADFHTGLLRYGVNVTEEQTQSIMSAVDEDRNGKLSLQEFEDFMKAQFELEAVTQDSQVGKYNKAKAKYKDIKREVVVALNQGVRITRTNSTTLDPTKQCDLSVVTDEAIEKRIKISKHPQVMVAFAKWWRAFQASKRHKAVIPRFNGGAAPRAGPFDRRFSLDKSERQSALTMSQEEYCAMLVALSRHLNHSKSAAKAKKQALEDWELEKNKGWVGI
jgi:hypothetical protein